MQHVGSSLDVSFPGCQEVWLEEAQCLFEGLPVARNAKGHICDRLVVVPSEARCHHSIDRSWL